MPDFTFSDKDYEPEEPAGEHSWLFRRAGGSETQSIPADTRDDAWRGIRWSEGEDWRKWLLLGREDLVAEGDNVDEVALAFAARHSHVTEQWAENDGKKN